MPLIYQPHGAAREYAPLACNLYRGCTHGCTYCYVPGVLRADKGEFHAEVRPKGGGDGSYILGQLEREAARLAEKGVKGPVLLSFTTDPYQPAEAKYHLTRQALEILALYKIRAVVLTKGEIVPEGDLNLMGINQHIFGVTLTGVQTKSCLVEPDAAPNHIRIANLHAAKQMGVCTWASIEPVIYPGYSLNAISLSCRYCDHFAIGKLNHEDPPEPIDWRAFLEMTVRLLRGHGYREVSMEEGWQKPPGTYYLKRDLLEAAK